MPVFRVPFEGPKLSTYRDAAELISQSAGCDAIIIPIERLDDDFFRLRTGVAGEMVQKFVTYRRRVIFLGDVSRWIEESNSFRDFVIESNRGRDIWFVANQRELDARLATLCAPDSTSSSQP